MGLRSDRYTVRVQELAVFRVTKTYQRGTSEGATLFSSPGQHMIRENSYLKSRDFFPKFPQVSTG